MIPESAGRIAVVGGGSWGTAFAALLAERHKDVSLWVREEGVCATIRSDRENREFLPGVKVPESVRVTTNVITSYSIHYTKLYEAFKQVIKCFT